MFRFAYIGYEFSRYNLENRSHRKHKHNHTLKATRSPPCDPLKDKTTTTGKGKRWERFKCRVNSTVYGEFDGSSSA
jgi:hypothetical protein